MAETYRNLEERDAIQEKELSGAMVSDMTGDELEKILSARADGQRHGDRIRHR